MVHLRLMSVPWLEKYQRSRSSFEGFFASKGAAYALPDGDFARQASTSYGGEMQLHLQSMVNLLRDEDVLRLVVKLESKWPDKTRYVAIASAFGLSDVEESVAIGIDWDITEQIASIGLVVPLYRDTAIRMDGDGGFKLKSGEKSHILKAVSVQTMWTALQWIHKCQANASKYNFYRGGPSHSWVSYYSDKITCDKESLAEWHQMDDLWSKRPEPIIGLSKEKELIMKLIRHKLKEVMMRVDLEDVTCRQLREMVEEETQIDLKEWKSYFDEEMLNILGQMDSSSQIFDYLYLGSEWNASNLEELKENGVGYILNITREIDNFFTGTFVYYNIRVYDEEETNLLPHWGKTFEFIKKAQKAGSKCLVHCKMGISRSASSVIAFAMKEHGWSLNDAAKFVKSKRSCIQPNPSFWKQLITYEGILNSSKQRYNELFTRGRTHSDSAEIREKARRRREARGNKTKHHTLEKCMPLSNETEESVKATEMGADVTDEQALADKDLGLPSGSDEDSSESDVAEGDDNDDAFQSVVSPENEVPEAAVLQSLPPKDTRSAPDLTRETEVESDAAAGLESSVTPVKQQISLHRVKSVPTLPDPVTTSGASSQPDDTNNVQRSSSLRERGRKRLSDTDLWKGIKSSSAEHLNEFGGKASLWDAIEKSEEEFSAREQEERRTLAEGSEQGASQVVEVEPEVREEADEENNLPVKMVQSEMEADKTDVEMQQKETDTVAESSPGEGTLKRPRPYVGVPKEVIEVAESGLVKRHSRNFEECQPVVKVFSDNDVLNSPIEEAGNREEAANASAESEDKGRLDEKALSFEDGGFDGVQSRGERDAGVQKGLVRKQMQGFELQQQEVAQPTLRSESFGGAAEDISVGQEVQVVSQEGDKLGGTQGAAQAPGSQEFMGGKCEPPAELCGASTQSETKVQNFAKHAGEEPSHEGEVQAGLEASGKVEGEEVVKLRGGETSAVQRSGDDQDTNRETKEANDEIPRPGLVKRNTLLLEEKARELVTLEAGRSLKAPVDDRPTLTEGDSTSTQLVLDASLTPAGVRCESESGNEEAEREQEGTQGDEQSTSWLEQNAGMVVRHKRMIEERLQAKDAASKAQKVTNEKEVDGGVEEAIDQSFSEGGCSSPNSDSASTWPSKGDTAIKAPRDSTRDVNTNPETDEIFINESTPDEQPLETSDHGNECLGGDTESGQGELAVDTSSVVNVKTHTQLLEEWLRGAGAQASPNVTQKQESSKTEQEENALEPAPRSPEEVSQKTNETQVVEVVSTSSTETDEAVGNVRRKTQLLERLIQDVAKAAEVFAQTKHNPALRRPVLRRNESLKVERVVDRSSLSHRRRSSSDVCRK